MGKKQKLIILGIIALFDCLVLVCIIWVMIILSQPNERKNINVHHTIQREMDTTEVISTSGTVESNENIDVKIEEKIESYEVSKNDYSGYLDTEGTMRIKQMLQGASFYVNNTIVFTFGSAESYSGFYDSNNTNVKNYSYELINIYDEYLLNIYDTEKYSAVTYKIIIENENEIYLYYEAADIKMRLIRL